MSDDDLGTVTRKIINGKTLRYIHIANKAIVLKSDMQESQIVSYLMVDFPPISKEDNPKVMAVYVVTHFEQTREIINYSGIPKNAIGVPLKVASKKRKSKKVVSKAVKESKPKPKKQKKSKKSPTLNFIESTLPEIQDEVADLGPVEVLSTRTRGGSSGAASQPKPKVHTKGKKQIKKLKMSKYT